MSIQKDYKDQIIVEFKKAKKILLSCNNREQLEAAIRYYFLWERKYKPYFKIGNPTVLYGGGLLVGIIHGMTKFYPKSHD